MTEGLVDSHVFRAQIHTAVQALISHIRKSKSRDDEVELLGSREDFVWLVLATKRMHPEQRLKPFKIPLPHPLVDPTNSSICLITKDPQRQYKDLLAAKDVNCVSRVVGIEKLKGKYKPFETRRQLLRENGLFLADERVVPMLPKLLGKMFFEAKKQPIPVCLTKKDLKGELEGAISSTYMHHNNGTCTSIKIALSSETAQHMIENLVIALPAVVANTREGWENVQSLHIKTSRSVSLPIWSCDLEAGTQSSPPPSQGITPSIGLSIAELKSKRIRQLQAKKEKVAKGKNQLTGRGAKGRILGKVPVTSLVLQSESMLV